MNWASPWAFTFFIPLFLIVFINYINKKNKPGFGFSSVSEIKNIPTGIRVKLKALPYILKLISISLFIIALARPQVSDVKVRRNVEGIDITIALDISDSMLIEDMKPKNRLESSKKTIANFISKRISDRIGLLVFSGESYTRVPLTLDYPLLLENLKQVKTTRNIKMGTAIGVALSSAVSRLKDSTAKTRVVIFLTDGENNSGTIDPYTAIDIAKGFGIKIYSIGMGRDGQASIPYQEERFGRIIKRYRPIHSKINEDLLNKMAVDTGGKYFRANTSNSLKGVFNSINSLEKTKIETNSFTKYKEMFFGYLIWGFILYILSVLLNKTLLKRGL